MEQNRHSGGERLRALDAAANNTDLWTAYLHGQMRAWFDPLGLLPPTTVDALARPLADAAAAAVSGWLSLVAAPTVHAMYEANEPQVTRFVQEQAVDPEAIEIPAPFSAPRPAPRIAAYAPTQLEEWAVTSIRQLEPALA